MNKKEQIANLIFPNIKETIQDLEKKYPERNLPEGAIVTRFAPSPTGFLHTGSLFTSLVSQRFAKQTDGVFYLRLEDTDQKREIKGSGARVMNQLNIFGVVPDESFDCDGLYGPYIQSQRKIIYHTVIKDMLINDLAYPCFCSHEDLADIRKYQEEHKLLPGYYKEFAKCRNLKDDDVIDRINRGDSYVIRFKSSGNEDAKVDLYDAIRGHIQFPENIQDIVIMKSDSLPTYHFAHVVDDHFMRTTHVTRGEEWMSSVPIHLELFKALNFDLPIYCHFPVIMKLDNGKRRKLSKRKDEEASVDYFLERGYPIEGFLEYLMTLANSNFEEWRIQHPHDDIFNFKLSFNKMSLDGALFDIEKIKSISKERLAFMTADIFAKNALEYAKKYDAKLKEIIERDFDYFKSIINIERNQSKPRKDYEKYSDIFPIINFMYDEYFQASVRQGLSFNERYSSDQIISILKEYEENNGISLSQDEWFQNMKEMAISRGFAAKGKDFKKNPGKYIGTIGDYAEILRIAICAKKNTPNFYEILKILGEEKVVKRINLAIQTL